MIVVVGLGNQGKEYENTRHNAGFIVLDKLSKTFSTSEFRVKLDSYLNECVISGEKFLLLKPSGFMNNSGFSVSRVVKFYKIHPSSVIVIHDDLDVEIGRVKTKFSGGNGGHNGLRSIDASIGADYWRIRIGISHPGDKDKVSNYVLSEFNKNTELPVIEKVSKAITNNMSLFLQNDKSLFTNNTMREIHGH